MYICENIYQNWIKWEDTRHECFIACQCINHNAEEQKNLFKIVICQNKTKQKTKQNKQTNNKKKKHPQVCKIWLYFSHVWFSRSKYIKTIPLLFEMILTYALFFCHIGQHNYLHKYKIVYFALKICFGTWSV